jgi:type I restriction enzyme R subunit
MLEELRRNLRLLIQFLDKMKREVVYTTFEDELGDITDKNVVGIMGAGSGLAQYRKKVEAYIKSHEDHLTIQRIKRNRPVTVQDLEQLDAMLFQASGMDNREDYDKTIHPDRPLGVFIRELVGLDRAAAKEAFAQFLTDTTMNSTQIQFINTLIDYLTQNGVMEPKQLAQPPFSDLHDESVFGLFSEQQVHVLSQKIRWINQNAEAMAEEVPLNKAADGSGIY